MTESILTAALTPLHLGWSFDGPLPASVARGLRSYVMTGSTPDTDEREAVLATARRAKDAAVDLATASRAAKDAALIAMADALVTHSDVIVTANAKDVARAKENGTADGIVDRLTLTPDRIAAIADALRDVADLADPVGVVIRGWTQPNGLQIRQVRVPLGVLGIIYEARPNVTVDAAGLGLKSGNAVLLRGSSSAYDSNTALVDVMQDALEASGLPRDAVQLVPGTSHESVKHLITARGLVDVVIPRGGAALIRSVVEDSTVPSIETGIGNCHVYVDKDADVDKAVRILVNCQGPAAERLQRRRDVPRPRRHRRRVPAQGTHRTQGRRRHGAR